MENSDTNKLLSALSSTTACIMGINEKIDKLNDSINKSSESSSKLAEALNKLTRLGLGVGAAGVAVALGHLILNIVQYVCK